MTVFVSGATGFIATHTIKQLLDKGYPVVGSVRSDAKGEKLVRQLNNPKFSYVVVKDISEAGAFDNAIKSHPDTKVFIHAASPIIFQSDDVEKEVLSPAIDGTKNVLQAIQQYGSNIEHVVVTSSFSAISPYERGEDSTTYTEESWNPVTYADAVANSAVGYPASKTEAEKAVWAFVKEKQPKYSVSVVNPVFVFGPQVFDEDAAGDLNVSNLVIDGVFKTAPGLDIFFLNGAAIDVRDVAKAHIAGFENPAAYNKRLFVANERFSTLTLADTIHKEFPQLADKVAKGNGTAPDAPKIDNTATRELLGFEFTPLRTTVKDVVEQILRVRA